MSKREMSTRDGADRGHDFGAARETEPAPPILAWTPASIVALQRSVGNAAVAAWLAESRSQPLSESFAGEGPDHNRKEGGAAGSEGEVAEGLEDARAESSDDAAGKSPAAETTVVSATITGDGVAQATSDGEPGVSSEKIAKHEVKPTGSTTYNGTAAGSDCLPADILPADVDWNVKDNGATWGPLVTAFRTTGKINVNPTPNKPAEMTTPNTPNPVDGGNIENKAGSNNHWTFAIAQMRKYNTAGGGRSRHWHSTAASNAHEYEHWNTDWIKNVLGGLWPQANKDIDAITIPKKDAADEAAARPLLKQKVDARISTANSKSTTDWNAVPDEPGLAGANGYMAGQKVLDGLITAVEDYAKTKKW